jgi:hypothetical protein
MKGMGPMTKAVLATLLLLFTAAFDAAAPSAWGGEGNQLDQAKAAVERSALPREVKVGILTSAEQAVAEGIPSEDVSIIIIRSLDRGVDGRHIEGFLETASKTKIQGLPVRLILDRTEQGLAKGVPSERIGTVTQRLSEHLAAATSVVSRLEASGMKAPNPRASDDAIENVARAMEMSIPQNTLAKMGEKIRDRKGSLGLFNRAVDTTTTFAGSGMSAGQASRLVQSALDKGYSEQDLEAMERYMADELRKNRPMNDVISGMDSRMERGEMTPEMQMQERPGAGPMSGPGTGGMGGMGGRR